MHTGLIALELIAGIYDINIDLRSIIRKYALTENEVSREEFIRILRECDFKAKIKTLALNDFVNKYPLPAIILNNDNKYNILLKIDPAEKKILVYFPEIKNTRVLTFDEFLQNSTNEYIVLNHKKLNNQVKFGFQWFFHEILKHKRTITEVLLGSFIVQIFGLTMPLFTQVILDKVIVHRSISTLNVITLAFIVIAIFEFIINYSRNYIFIHTASKIDIRLGKKLFQHLFSLPYVYFENRKVGNIISRIKELDRIRDFITNKSLSLIIDSIFSLVFVFIMLIYSVKLTFIVLGFIFLLSLMYLIITPEFRSRLENNFQMGAQSNSYLVESVTGIQTVKSLALEGSLQKNWENYLGEYVFSNFKLANLGNIFNSISKILQKLMTISILYLGVQLVIESKLSIGQLIAFNMFASQITGPVIRLVSLWNEFQQAILSVGRIGDILNHAAEIQTSKAITLPKLEGAISFKNVFFKYGNNTNYALKDLSFEISAGMSIGIVGKSGSGKSTVAKLIQRLYVPNEGAIYIDSIDVRHMNPGWLRNNIGIVLQESYLFSGNIRENIAMAKPNASIENIIEAAKISGIHDFISQLPEGYDTVVGERGSTLSGGQKQRIAIARALITNPRILVFDEATSSLDYESENIIQKNIEHIKKGRTTIMIAHRLTTVQNCNLIIALDQGHVIEMGTHEELLRKKGYYYDLSCRQEIKNV